MTSKARLRQVETVLQAVVEVHPVAMEPVAVGHLVALEGHLVGVLPVVVMVHQQVVQAPLSRPAEEEVVHQEAVVVLQGVVVVQWDQVPLRPMPR